MITPGVIFSKVVSNELGSVLLSTVRPVDEFRKCFFCKGLPLVELVGDWVR